jgi:hypothetical protein
MARQTKAQREEAETVRSESLETLRRIFTPAGRNRLTHFFVVCDWRTATGTRYYRVFVGNKDGSAACITFSVAKACRLTLQQKNENYIVLHGGNYAGGDSIRTELSRVLGVPLTVTEY